MAQACSICSHPNRQEIEKLVATPGVSLREIVSRVGNCSTASVSRHTKNCIARALQAARLSPAKLIESERERVTVKTIQSEMAQRARNGEVSTIASVEKELGRCFERVNKLFDACDTWLDDPEKPGEYSLDAHASEVRIIYEELTEQGEWIRKAASLQDVLAIAFCNGHRRMVKANPIKMSDTRKLLLDAANQLSSQIELLAKLEGRFRPVEKELGEGTTIQLSVVQNILVQNGILR